MNYKTMVLCAVIGTSMQNAWGMNEDNTALKPNGQNNPMLKPEASDTAQLAAKLKELEETLAEKDARIKELEVTICNMRRAQERESWQDSLDL
jgi:outer membrane receptor for monomeric catechols